MLPCKSPTIVTGLAAVAAGIITTLALSRIARRAAVSTYAHDHSLAVLASRAAHLADPVQRQSGIPGRLRSARVEDVASAAVGSVVVCIAGVLGTWALIVVHKAGGEGSDQLGSLQLVLLVQLVCLVEQLPFRGVEAAGGSEGSREIISAIASDQP